LPDRRFDLERRSVFPLRWSWLCPLAGFLWSTGGFRYSPDGFQTIANGFIYSVRARNWWDDGFRSTDAAKNTFQRATKTVAGPPSCSTPAKNTVAGAKVHLVLPNFGSAPPGKTIDRAKKTVERAKKTIANGFRWSERAAAPFMHAGKCRGMVACFKI
jgi:hypothetical protein